MRPILNDPLIEPTPSVLKYEMGERYSCYLELLECTHRHSISPMWAYYKDGKSWLCKMMYKKKNVFWFSVWENCLKTTFYFTEKDLEHIAELAISESIKSEFSLQKSIGKLIPMIIEIRDNEPLADLDLIIAYKLSKK